MNKQQQLITVHHWLDASNSNNPTTDIFYWTCRHPIMQILC